MDLAKSEIPSSFADKSQFECWIPFYWSVGRALWFTCPVMHEVLYQSLSEDQYPNIPLPRLTLLSIIQEKMEVLKLFNTRDNGLKWIVQSFSFEWNAFSLSLTRSCEPSFFSVQLYFSKCHLMLLSPICMPLWIDKGFLLWWILPDGVSFNQALFVNSHPFWHDIVCIKWWFYLEASQYYVCFQHTWCHFFWKKPGSCRWESIRTRYGSWH